MRPWTSGTHQTKDLSITKTQQCSRKPRYRYTTTHSSMAAQISISQPLYKPPYSTTPPTLRTPLLHSTLPHNAPPHYQISKSFLHSHRLLSALIAGRDRHHSPSLVPLSNAHNLVICLSSSAQFNSITTPTNRPTMQASKKTAEIMFPTDTGPNDTVVKSSVPGSWSDLQMPYL